MCCLDLTVDCSSSTANTTVNTSVLISPTPISDVPINIAATYIQPDPIQANEPVLTMNNSMTADTSLPGNISLMSENTLTNLLANSDEETDLDATHVTIPDSQL